jgi:hypothetical protein
MKPNFPFARLCIINAHALKVYRAKRFSSNVMRIRERRNVVTIFRPAEDLLAFAKARVAYSNLYERATISTFA